MATKTPSQGNFDLNQLLDDLETQPAPEKNNRKFIWIFIVLVISLIAGLAFTFFNNNSQVEGTSSNQLLGPTDAVESFGWEELDSVCLNNRIIGAAPLKGICGPTWEKIFTQVSQLVPGPTEVVTVTETETVTVFRPGNRVYLAERNPINREGISGDVFINRASGDLFRKDETAWTLSANLTVERIVTETNTQVVVQTVTVSDGSGTTGFSTCDDTVFVDITPAYVASITSLPANAKWIISSLRFSQINDLCIGKRLMIQLLNSNDETIATGELVILDNSDPDNNFISFECTPNPTTGLCNGDLTTPVGVTELTSNAQDLVFAIYD